MLTKNSIHQHTLKFITVLMILLNLTEFVTSKTAIAKDHWDGPVHKTSEAVHYKCLFNHELLIITSKKDNSPEYIKSFIEKLDGTAVDAVMCCPTAWRTNVFPSQVDPWWKSYKPGQVTERFRAYDYIMEYIYNGGDPVKETLQACREANIDFIISYRMNDHHYVADTTWPTHNFIWRDHPEYWLGNSNSWADFNAKTFTDDEARLLNYMIPEVRDYYYAIIEELCTNYDVDGVELDFQRYHKFFYNKEIKEGTKVMTAFVQRIRNMLDRIGKERGKSLKLSVRVPETLAKCKITGLDVPGWDAMGLIDMIDISPYYKHTMELGIEEFKSKIKQAKLYGEMNYITFNKRLDVPYSSKHQHTSANRYTTPEIYRASALNFFYRGADGLCLFNYDYGPKENRPVLAKELKNITDLEHLYHMSKNYVISPNFGTFPATDKKTVELVIPDDTNKVKFKKAIMRVETKEPCTDLRIAVWLNGKVLESVENKETELFTPMAKNEAYPSRELLKFYSVSLELIVPGKNRIKIKNLDKDKTSCEFYSLEFALYR